MKALFVTHSIKIHASAEKVWQVLVDPAFTRQYMFGCDALSDWKVGSPLVWKGGDVVYVKGNIVEIEAPRLLKYTTIGVNMGFEDVPSNYLMMTYTLTPKGDGVVLEMSQGDYAQVIDGQKRYEHTIAGGDGLMPKIKALAEAN